MSSSLTQERAERFVRLWQASGSVAECASAYGCAVRSASRYAADLRARGVPLKKFSSSRYGSSPIDLDALRSMVGAANGG